MAKLHANRPHKPGRFQGLGPIKIQSKDGVYATTTWPWQRKDKNGDQKPVPGIIIDKTWGG